MDGFVLTFEKPVQNPPLMSTMVALLASAGRHATKASRLKKARTR